MGVCETIEGKKDNSPMERSPVVLNPAYILVCTPTDETVSWNSCLAVSAGGRWGEEEEGGDDSGCGCDGGGGDGDDGHSPASLSSLLCSERTDS